LNGSASKAVVYIQALVWFWPGVGVCCDCSFVGMIV
jgi:hypothetical protein